jgi:hypothetical protein
MGVVYNEGGEKSSGGEWGGYPSSDLRKYGLKGIASYLQYPPTDAYSLIYIAKLRSKPSSADQNTTASPASSRCCGGSAALFQQT